MTIFTPEPTPELAARVAALEALVQTLSGSVAANAQASDAAIGAVSGQRQSGDAASLQAVHVEADARVAGDQANADAIGQEIAARVAGDAINSGKVQELNERVDGVVGEIEEYVGEARTEIDQKLAQAGTHAATAGTQAGIATTQAGIATAAAGVATTAQGAVAAYAAQVAADAGTSVTQAGIATTQAGISTTQAALATTAKAGADVVLAQMVAARDAALAALIGGNIFRAATIDAAKAAGLAAVSEAQTFAATGDDVAYIGLFKDVAGVAVEQFQFTNYSEFQAALVLAQAAANDVAVRKRGLGGADRLTDAMQTSDQLTLRVGTRLDLVRNRIVGPEYSSELAHRFLQAVVTWGHSAFEGSGATFAPIGDLSIKSRLDPSGAGYNSLPGKLQSYLGSDWEVYNKGFSIQQSEAIGARAGAIPVRVSVTGDQIPAGGVTAMLTAILPTPGPLEAGGNRGASIAGTINGSPVRLTINSAGTVYSIQQPASAIAPLSVPAGSIFVPAGTNEFRHMINLIWPDRNGGNLLSAKYVTGQIVARVHGGRYLVFGDWNAQNEPNGSARLNTALAINAYYESAYPGHFFDVRGFARGDYPYNGNVMPSAAQLAGITLDSNNLADIGNGLFPRVFSPGGGDTTHFNTIFNDAAAKLLKTYWFPRLGWSY